YARWPELPRKTGELDPRPARCARVVSALTGGGGATTRRASADEVLQLAVAGRRLLGELVQPGVEVVRARPGGDRAPARRQVVVGRRQRRVVRRGLARHDLLEHRLEARRLVPLRLLVPLLELGQHLATEELEALHDVLVAVLARLRREDHLVDA